MHGEPAVAENIPALQATQEPAKEALPAGQAVGCNVGGGVGPAVG